MLRISDELAEQPPHCFFTELLAKQDISEREAVEFAEELFIAGVESVSYL